MSHTDSQNVVYTLDSVSYTAVVTLSPLVTGSITIPNELVFPGIGTYTVIAIDISAFQSTFLTSISIPGSVTTIGKHAFDTCALLTTVTFDDVSLLTYIGEYAFKGCATLTGLDVYDAPLTSIEKSTFDSCQMMTSFDIPDSVTWIGSSAFLECTALGTVSFPPGLTDIEIDIFSGCTSLVSLVGFESTSVASLSDNVFDGCASLTSVALPASITSIGHRAFDSCILLTSVSFGDASSLTEIHDYAFVGCTVLPEIILPDTVVSISSDVFSGCELLASVYLPDGITTIGNNAFDDCVALTEVTLPDQVTSIGSAAFDGCTGLTTAYVTSTALDALGLIVSPPDQPFYGPTVAIVLQNDRIWKDSQHVRYSYTIGETNAMVIASPDVEGPIAIPTFIARPNATTYAVTSIDDSAFEDVEDLISVSIPSSVTSIGKGAFELCANLVTVSLPDASVTLGARIFQGCIALATVHFPDNFTTIGTRMFYDCISLASVVLPSRLSIIRHSAFGRCLMLEVITIPDTILAIHDDAFTESGLQIAYVLQKTADLFGLHGGPDQDFFGATGVTITITDYEFAITITSPITASGASVNTAVLLVVFTSEDPLVSFTSDDVSTAGGTLSSLTTVSDRVYTALFTVRDSCVVSSIWIEENTVWAINGHGNSATSAFSFTYAPLCPIAPILPTGVLAPNASNESRKMRQAQKIKNSSHHGGMKYVSNKPKTDSNIRLIGDVQYTSSLTFYYYAKPLTIGQFFSSFPWTNYGVTQQDSLKMATLYITMLINVQRRLSAEIKFPYYMTPPGSGGIPRVYYLTYEDGCIINCDGISMCVGDCTTQSSGCYGGIPLDSPEKYYFAFYKS